MREAARTYLALLGGPVLLLTAYFTVPLGWFGPHHAAVSWTVFGTLLAVLGVGLLREARMQVLGRSRHPVPRILTLLCGALVVFAAAYLGMSRQPGELDGLTTKIDALYFTVITMATVGYGDIHPAGQAARVVVMLQLLYTFVFLTTGVTALTRQVRTRAVRRSRHEE
ncbi:ion channel [Kitasatospora sp. SolWspMP-SS2h]|uniref:potassium channel family protein n=1 Tax=Kitasatospora sp. SolWspMP-SS2h TaxID=1305729 RepID=UPI000DBF455F|nr:potassium channel family protein [Kitasatospora sp. SolWspMP-SS2h]RAJ42344.1 ion channel [Kitasatospora sp. SolWspMP-SS2h]